MKTLLITGATDGIGRATALRLAQKGHRVVVHGRNPTKVQQVRDAIAPLHADADGGGHVADLAVWSDVERIADEVRAQHTRLDVVIHNAGVYNAPSPAAAKTESGWDLRFAVNTIAPYWLTLRWRSLLPNDGRVVALSSAAQAPVDIDALRGQRALGDHAAYAQSKLALTAWAHHLGRTWGADAPVVVAVNPGSMLGTKMVQRAFGVAGGDVGIGAGVLVDAALSERFADATGRYYDNDNGRFAPPHPDANDPVKCAALVALLDDELHKKGGAC